jgi:hypothetical protein
MRNRIKLVQGDTRPEMEITIYDGLTGNAIDITGSTVRLKFRELGSEIVRSTLVGSNVYPQEGVVVFSWADDPNALDGEPGPYEAEIEITFPDNSIQTVYDPLKFYVREDF